MLPPWLKSGVTAPKFLMNNRIEKKTKELKNDLSQIGKRLDAGDDRELLVWVIPNELACAHRPLRHHPQFGGSGRDLPPESSFDVLKWVERIKSEGIRGIISLMHPKELRHYDRLDLGAKDLIDLYRKYRFEVCHIPWKDPRHRPQSGRFSYQEELERIRQKALRAFDELLKPVLLQCSAGIDRSSPVAAYIWGNRMGE